jgi:uncharacterized protein
MFDEKTKQNLKYYVYFLIDPTTNQPFYIGKGKDDRVFNHLKCALEFENISDKYGKIREITNNNKNVGHIIVRHGLSEKDALEIEATLIDVLDFLKSGLTNIMGGQKSIEKGLMTSDEVIRLYNAEPLLEISNDCVIININQQYERGNGEDAIYKATKETWTIEKSRIDNLKIVLSEYKGLIVEVFQVDNWYEKERGYNLGAKKYGQIKVGYGFNGRIASDEIRNLYINKSISHVKKQGSATVLRYNI